MYTVDSIVSYIYIYTNFLYFTLTVFSHHSSSSSSRPYPYKVLCISSLHGKASDENVRETLYREFKKFGEISVKVVHEPDERVAYVYFRSYEDARDAKHAKARILVFDKPVMIEAAYESSSSNSAPASSYKPPGDSYGDRDRDRDRGYGGGGGGNYRRYALKTTTQILSSTSSSVYCGPGVVLMVV